MFLNLELEYERVSSNTKPSGEDIRRSIAADLSIIIGAAKEIR